MYLAVKAHFTNMDYDFFEYNGRIRGTTLEKFAAKSYYSVICRLSQQYEGHELIYYYVSNMLYNSGQHIFDIDSDGKRIYNEYVRRKESRTYSFKQEIGKIRDELEKLQLTDFWCSIDVVDGQHPLLLQMFVGGYVSPETMCILFQIKDYISIWDKSIKDALLHPMVAAQIKKYSPFVRIKNHAPFKQIIDSTF